MSWESLIAPFTEEPIPWFSTALVIFAAWLMGFSRSGLGAGGFVVSPLTVLAVGADDGLAIIAVIMIPAGAIGCWQHRKALERQWLNPLIPAAFFGTILGGLVLWMIISSGEMSIVHRRLEFVVAGLSLLYVVLVSFRDKIVKLGGGSGPPSSKGVFTFGCLLAISQTVANSGTPLLTVYFIRHGITKERFVAAQNAFLTVQNTIKVVPFLILGLLHLGNAGAALLLFPLTLVGSWCGKHFYQMASERVYFGCYIALLVIGFLSSAILIWGRTNFYHLFH